MFGAQSMPRSTATSAETTAPLAAIAASFDDDDDPRSTGQSAPTRQSHSFQVR